MTTKIPDDEPGAGLYHTLKDVERTISKGLPPEEVERGLAMLQRSEPVMLEGTDDFQAVIVPEGAGLYLVYLNEVARSYIPE